MGKMIDLSNTVCANGNDGHKIGKVEDPRPDKPWVVCSICGLPVDEKKIEGYEPDEEPKNK